MKKKTGWIFLLLTFSIQGLAQWKTLPVPTSKLHRNNLKVEVNRTADKTRLTNLRTGKKEMLDYCVQNHQFVGNYLCLKRVTVLGEEKTEVIFRVYDIRDGQFLRDIHLFRKTYDYTKIEFGETFILHPTFPKGNALFFILHEDCEGTPSGEQAYLYCGENLKPEKVVPLPDKMLGVWINDNMTELTAVTGDKRIVKKSLKTGEIIWKLGPGDFACDWFNYRPGLVLNRYLCIIGSNNRDPKSCYYIVDMKTGKILDTVSTDEIGGTLTLIDYCKNLSKETDQE